MGSHWVNLGHFEHQKRKKEKKEKIKNNDGMIKDTLNFKVHNT